MEKPIEKMIQTTLAKNGFGIPALSAIQQSKFDELMAAHYYVTGNAFERIECPYLKAAIELIRPQERRYPIESDDPVSDLLDTTAAKLVKRANRYSPFRGEYVWHVVF